MDELIRREARSLEPGDVSAAARLLAARFRSGELSRARLVAAAQFGSEAAALVLGCPVPPDLSNDARDRDEGWPSLTARLRTIANEDQRAAVFVAVTCARVVLPAWLERHVDVRAPEEALAAAAAWVDDPTPHRASVAVEAGFEAELAVIGGTHLFERELGHADPGLAAADAALACATSPEQLEGRYEDWRACCITSVTCAADAAQHPKHLLPRVAWTIVEWALG